MSGEGFAMVPDRFFAALRWGDVTYDAFVVGCFLCRYADHRTKTYTGTLEEIASGVRWKKSEDTLGRVLVALRDADWVEFKLLQGQRRPYAIRLTALLRETRLPHDLRKSRVDFAEVTSAPSTDATSANVLVERGRDGKTTSAQNDDCPSTSKALRSEQNNLGWENQADGVTFDKESLAADVRQAVERAERHRRISTMPLLGDEGFSSFSRHSQRAGRLTHAEHCDNLRAHQLARSTSKSVGGHEFVHLLMEHFSGSELRDIGP
jgi:hypothetical protein